MYRYLTFLGKLTYLLLFLCISSCGTKNKEKVMSTVLTNENTESKIILKSPETSGQPKQKFNFYNNFKSSKYMKILNENFHYNVDLPKNITLYPEENVFVVNKVPAEFTSFDMYKRFFNNFEIIGYSVFTYNKSLKINYIENIAKQKGTNVVIIKKLYNKDKDNYIYDLLFLKGDLYNKNYYWMRSSDEAIPISNTLENIKNSKTNLKVPDLATQLGLKKIDDDSKVNSNEEVNLSQNLNYDVNNFFEIMQSKDIDSKDLRNQQIDIMDKDYKNLENRVASVVGLWMDSYDKSIIRIQELSSDQILKDDKNAFISSKDKYYGAYMDFKDDDSLQAYNSHESLNKDPKLSWHNNDLKFQFNSTGTKGVFLDYNKMPVPALINVFPAKGVLMVNLPNGEIRYYIPVDVTNINPEVMKSLYSKLPAFVKGKDSSIKSKIVSSKDSVLYSWVISTGLLLLGLGVISFI